VRATIARIEARIARGEAPRVDFPVAPTRRAAVAVVLREGGTGAEVLLIKRAERAGDPWSGHVAFPGGRADPEDASIEATAEREAREEVGLDLAPPAARRIGRLPDHPGRAAGRWIGLAITPVLYQVVGDPPLALDRAEVEATFWAPLAALASGRHDGRMLHWWRPLRRLPLSLPFVLPCWRYEGFTIWGLTHRMLRGLLEVAGPFEREREPAGAA
jgi:8-oxo-dGTP pyrophosphatase MutT (NUDIX family)